ncbi:hypothetical protein ACQBAR_15695 [Propionibacteriaceae bacterium Y1685]
MTESHSDDALIAMSETIEEARGLVSRLFDDMKNQFVGPLGLQHRYTIGTRNGPEMSGEQLFKNTRNAIWTPVAGGPLPPFDAYGKSAIPAISTSWMHSSPSHSLRPSRPATSWTRQRPSQTI